MKLSTNIIELVREIATLFQSVYSKLSGNTTGDLSGLTTTEKTSLLAAVNELDATVKQINEDLDLKLSVDLEVLSLGRNHYFYRDQDPEADTAGDWRTWADDNGYYTEYCSVANATKGAGTWVLKHTIQP